MEGLVKAKFAYTQKNKAVLVDTKNFEYLKRNSISGSDYWRCRNYKTNNCTASAVTTLPDENKDVYIKKVSGEHNHGNHLINKRVANIEKEAIENAARNPTIPTRNILCSLSNTLQTDSPAAAASMSRLATLKMKIYRARRDKLGVNTLPKTSQDMLNLPEEYKKLDSGEQFLVSAEMVDDEHVSLIFMSGKFV